MTRVALVLLGTRTNMASASPTDQALPGRLGSGLSPKDPAGRVGSERRGSDIAESSSTEFGRLGKEVVVSELIPAASSKTGSSESSLIITLD
jgi:hypothetical protein